MANALSLGRTADLYIGCLIERTNTEIVLDVSVGIIPQGKEFHRKLHAKPWMEDEFVKTATKEVAAIIMRENPTYHYPNGDAMCCGADASEKSRRFPSDVNCLRCMDTEEYRNSRLGQALAGM